MVVVYWFPVNLHIAVLEQFPVFRTAAANIWGWRKPILSQDFCCQSTDPEWRGGLVSLGVGTKICEYCSTCHCDTRGLLHTEYSCWLIADANQYELRVRWSILWLFSNLLIPIRVITKMSSGQGLFIYIMSSTKKVRARYMKQVGILRRSSQVLLLIKLQVSASKIQAIRHNQWVLFVAD